jgi:glycosyltransferase involved in cell wall biosynthesis
VKILFLVRALTIGGAERQLTLLADRLSAAGRDVAVAAFYPGGGLESALEASGVLLHFFQKKGRWDVVAFAMSLYRFVRAQGPAIVHGYLPVPNVLAALLKIFIPGLKVVFGVRASNLDPSRYDRLSRLAFRLESFLSRYADLIIVNSRAGRDYHVRLGFPAAKLAVIPNGIDTARFRPDPAARQATRAAWNIGGNEILIGLIGRLDPMKDHPTFLEAATRLAEAHPEARFVCVGGGDPAYRDELRRLARERCLDGKLIWAESRSDMPAVYPALDVLASSSAYGEGFSNVIGEAMACGVPCVVTDVGDSAWIVGDTGPVVPPGDPAALADAWADLLRRLPEERAELAARTRARIEEHFGVEALVRNTLAALESLA